MATQPKEQKIEEAVEAVMPPPGRQLSEAATRQLWEAKQSPRKPNERLLAAARRYKEMFG